MQSFRVDAKKVGYFVLDNAYNNNTAVVALADEYSFKATYRLEILISRPADLTLLGRPACSFKRP